MMDMNKAFSNWSISLLEIHATDCAYCAVMLNAFLPCFGITFVSVNPDLANGAGDVLLALRNGLGMNVFRRQTVSFRNSR